ncbi:hypothetical protein B0J12DRAFT_361727 [Macrophomina phaseolina]|uniref:Uncharacterized protein n=1 Tax=Macrophomina phaseolina TaxID=35725 RepID=A0ABQ8FWE4_9PEZI|nr:hypothetical protein B0J12DRAFT_361727 [Macrophomina phaseolina]
MCLVWWRFFLAPNGLAGVGTPNSTKAIRSLITTIIQPNHGVLKQLKLSNRDEAIRIYIKSIGYQILGVLRLVYKLFKCSFKQDPSQK